MVDVPASYVSFIPECITKQGKKTFQKGNHLAHGIPPSVLAHDHRKGDSSPADLKKSCHDNQCFSGKLGGLQT